MSFSHPNINTHPFSHIGTDYRHDAAPAGEYTPVALVPLLLLVSIILILLTVCKLYRWNIERRQLECLAKIYDVLEEASPQCKSARRDPVTHRIQLHQAVTVPTEPSPFFQPRSRTTAHNQVALFVYTPTNSPILSTHI